MKYWFVLAALAVTTAIGQDQTYKVNSGSTQPQTETARPQTPAQKRQQPESSQKELGWGSNIQNARLARAAENALKSHNYAAAVDFAQRAHGFGE